MPDTNAKQYSIWDLPTRLFHWLIVIAIVLAWWSAETQRYELHETVGCTILVLVLSRIAWGLVGSKHARFSDFVRGPKQTVNYLRENSGASYLGHNPLGAWSVLVLLGLLLVQSVSGLFNTDDVLYSGPFYHIIGSQWQNRLGALHDLAFNTLLAFVVLHVLAVLCYQYRGHDLLRPMLWGKTAKRYAETAPVSFWWWLMIVLVLAIVLWQAIELAPAPKQAQWF